MTDYNKAQGESGKRSMIPDAIGDNGYQVLARKYRPTRFQDLVGQETVVRTLSNAIASSRVAQAYMLTGVRGTGKTTTARLIARSLNCIGSDGIGGPTVSPCGQCEHCCAIAEDRHVDVLELDAASRTGVDDIRELLDGVRYRPTSARNKIYIIDEVHMLSTQAFNALLKTLEEPPPHVKFIFATTEIRKVPVTVLSRCQRFDLRRIDADHLSKLFASIAEKENVAVTQGALKLIAQAADGSARDGLSILDQAISQASGSDSEAEIAEAAIRDMLGLADRVQIFDLLDAVLRGNIKDGLVLFTNQYNSGADPLAILQDLLELTHWLTRIKISPEVVNNVLVAEAERTRGLEMANGLSMPSLTRTWQMLLKGLGEARIAPVPFQAVEMTLVRLAYSAELPLPEEAVKALQDQDPTMNHPRTKPSSSLPSPPSHQATSAPIRRGLSSVAAAKAEPEGTHAVEPTQKITPDIDRDSEPKTVAEVRIKSLADVVVLCDAHRQAVLAGHLTHAVHLVRFEPGHIEFRPTAGTPQDLAGKLSAFLHEITKERWVVSISNAQGAPTLHEQVVAKVSADPVVKAILDFFPGAIVERVKNLDGNS
ncbi:MAG: DNA polymerase III subunit gamma/tau [Rhodospirillaceae bacterium]